MSHSLSDLLMTDEALDLIAFREFGGTDDLVLSGLASLAMAVDELPLPRSTPDPQAEPVAPRQPMSRSRKCGLAVSATVALMLSSGGVAAAVSGDVLAPLHYVAKQVLRIGPHGSGQLPGWDLEGSKRLSSVRSGDLVGVHLTLKPLGQGLVPSGGGASHSEPVGIGHGPGGSGPISTGGSGAGSGQGGGPTSPGGGHGPGQPGQPGLPGGSNPGDPSGPVTPTPPSRVRHGHHSIGAGLVSPLRLAGSRPPLRSTAPLRATHGSPTRAAASASAAGSAARACLRNGRSAPPSVGRGAGSPARVVAVPAGQ